ncbi:MAG TPA: hypothetical protein VKB42_14975 [Dongiaceae bacterium]|nr:hypothetical protein [Dongiaceae bacterium]
MSGRRFTLAGLIAIALVASLPALAEDPIKMSVIGYAKVPHGTGLDTKISVNDELNTYVEDRLRQALVARGFHLSGDVRRVFAVDAVKIGSTPPPPTYYDPEDAQMHLSIDTTGKVPPGEEFGHSFRISLDLYNRVTGHYLWRGEITDAKPDVDPFAATDQLLGRLLDAFLMSVEKGVPD